MKPYLLLYCFLSPWLELPTEGGGESRLDVNDLVVTNFFPSLLGRTAVYAPYEEGPCREQMMTGECFGQSQNAQAQC